MGNFGDRWLGWGRDHGSRVVHTSALALLVAGALLLGHERDAEACGACYASVNESTVVSDHKMALAVSTQQTILWDQISYSGNPSQFAYVVPARAGTRLEVSTDAFFDALDASTRPIIMAPQSTFGGGGGDGSTGCGCGAMAMSASMESAGGAPNAGEGVQIVDQRTVGPYETVTLRATEPAALPKWLRDHGFNVPEDSNPIIEDYVRQGMDFIALRLVPQTEVRSMKPIRLVTPGADATLPLRMMKIGIGPKVGVTMWVIGEGRYHPANFPDVTIDDKLLVWDYAQNRSNYQELSRRAMASGNGNGFITEIAHKPSLSLTGAYALPSGGMTNAGLADAYKILCVDKQKQTVGDGGVKDSGSRDSGPIDSGGVRDASVDDAGDLDGGADDASAPDGGDAGASRPDYPETYACDDLDVALAGLHASDVWVTRLRADLPGAALDVPLKLEPTKEQTPVSNVHQATTSGTITARVARLGVERQHGTYAIIAATALVVGRILAKRRGKK